MLYSYKRPLCYPRFYVTEVVLVPTSSVNQECIVVTFPYVWYIYLLNKICMPIFSEPRLNKRETLTSDTIFRLIRESSFVSGLNKTKMSYNNTTRILDSFLEEQETKDCGPVSKGSPGLNLTHSRLSNVYMNRRRNYVFDMNDIPEEIAEHSNDSIEHLQHLNETRNHQDTVAEEDENCETSVNQTNVFETPPILRLNPEALSAITNRKRSRRNLQKSIGKLKLLKSQDLLVITSEEYKLLGQFPLSENLHVSVFNSWAHSL